MEAGGDGEVLDRHSLRVSVLKIRFFSSFPLPSVSLPQMTAVTYDMGQGQLPYGSYTFFSSS